MGASLVIYNLELVFFSFKKNLHMETRGGAHFSFVLTKSARS